jgi:transcriptional regulator with XRE-family HTH domain
MDEGSAKCQCVARRSERIPVFNTTLPGIEVVLHDVADRIVCEACGRESVHVPNRRGLIAASAILRVLEPYKLNGREIRFLRKAIGWSATELAKWLEVTKESVSRWENDKQPMTSALEKLFRCAVASNLRTTAPLIDVSLEEITELRIDACNAQAKPAIELELAKASDLEMAQADDLTPAGAEDYREARAAA